MTRTVLIAIGITGASIWVGSLVCLAVVSVAAAQALDEHSRVALFRRVGRLYGRIGTGALLATIAVGAALVWPPTDIDGEIVALFVLAAALVVATFAGMAQARQMSAHRQSLLATPADQRVIERVQRGARTAGALRGSLAVITLAIVVLGAHALNR